MKIKLPKDLRGFAYDRVLPVDLNNFDVDILLPSVFFKTISGGQDRGRRSNDPTKIQDYVNKLAEHPDVAGFDGDAGFRLLDRFVRTSLVQIGRVGRARRDEQIEGLTSHTYLAFKAGFPAEGSRLRRVDSLLYRMMFKQMRGDELSRDFFRNIFGSGLTVVGGPEPDGKYDGSTDLDTITRLSICFLDGLATTGVRPAKDRPVREPCPAIAEHMARDLRRYLEAYRNRIPTEGLTYYFKALINFELFVYSMKLFYATAELVADPEELPPAMRPTLQPSSPDLYVDFTASATGLNREMASACVRRDIEAIQRFIVANLTLRQLDRYVHQIRRDRRIGQAVTEALADDEGGPEYLQALLQLRSDPTVSLRVDASARHDEEAIREEIRKRDAAPAPDDELSVESEEVDQIVAGARSDFERLVQLLVEGQRDSISQHALAWFWSVGGLTKRHGILCGALRSRPSWRYAPSNDWLAMLTQLAAVDIPKWHKDEPKAGSIGLQHFLHWLDERFGILVDRPPEGFAGPEYVAAAQENLRAMLHRLQQMGVFRDLSDDFTVQRLTPLYGADARVKESV